MCALPHGPRECAHGPRSAHSVTGQSDSGEGGGARAARRRGAVREEDRGDGAECEAAARAPAGASARPKPRPSGRAPKREFAKWESACGDSPRQGTSDPRKGTSNLEDALAHAPGDAMVLWCILQAARPSSLLLFDNARDILRRERSGSMATAAFAHRCPGGWYHMRARTVPRVGHSRVPHVSTQSTPCEYSECPM